VGAWSGSYRSQFVHRCAIQRSRCSCETSAPSGIGFCLLGRGSRSTAACERFVMLAVVVPYFK